MPPLGCQTSPPLEEKRRKKLVIHTLIHKFAHTLLSAPGAMSPDRLSRTQLAS